MRQLRLRMSDETVRSVMVDENQPVANLMVIICTKLGITNHDEFSLIATGKHTINGRRRERLQDGRIIDQKMEQLKKKLKTDEDLAWVDHSKTLDEQEIHEQDVVLLRRRFFYSDQNVDSRDPLQLGLLYVQTRDAILSGTHPVTLDGACKFAGLQCQAQLGDFMEGKTTRPGYINLKDYLPADCAKVKHVERKIFAEHKKYLGLSELEAKASYIGEARSLPTYGVTFFLVKEKVTGKGKLVPRLLGITKDCVMRVDADTKAVLKTWPLTTVKRWAASMNSFTLDFGDYSDSYYSVQTTEGEQISQLIAGYIDIILKRRKAKDHFGIEGDEGATMIEDSVAPSRATIIQNQPALQRPPSEAGPSLQDLASVAGPTVRKSLKELGPEVEPPVYRPAVEIKGKAEIGYESRPLTQYVTNYELSLPQRDLHDRLEQAQDAVEEAQRVLDRGQTSGSSLAARHRYEPREVDEKKRKLSNQFAEINAATAELVSLSAIPEEELNYPALNNAVETVAKSLPSVAKDVRIVASLMDDEASSERLIDAARKLCKAFSDLLNAAEPGPTVPRQSLISAASRVGDATQSLLCTINNNASRNGSDDEDDEARIEADNLLALAKSVASSAASLVLKAKDIAKTCQDDVLRNTVISSATQCALATSQMVATAKIVAPTIQDPACQRKLVDSCREVQRAVEGIQVACRDAIRNEQLLCKLDEAANRVNSNLGQLMEHVRTIKHTRTTTTTTTTTVTTTEKTNRRRDELEREGTAIPVTVQRDTNSPARGDLVEQARSVARATARLIEDIRPESTGSQYAHQQSSTTTSNTTNFRTREEQVEERRYQQQQSHESQQQSSSWQDVASNRPIQEAPEAAISGILGDLETSIMFATSGTLRASDDQPDSYQYHRESVLRCAKALVDDTRPLVGSQASTEQQLAQVAQESVYTMSRLAETVKASAASLGPANAESQVSLIKSVKGVAMSLSDLIGSTKSALGCEPNDSRSLQVNDSAKTMVASVTNLLHTVKTVEDEQQRGLRAIEATLEAIDQELSQFQGDCSIEPPPQLDPAQRSSASPEELCRLSRHVSVAASRTVQAANSGLQDDAIVAANMGQKAIRDLLQTVRLASLHSTDSYEVRQRLQAAGRSCAINYKLLIEHLHRIFQHPSLASANPELKQALLEQSKVVNQNVQQLIQMGDLLRGGDSYNPDANWHQQQTSTTRISTTVTEEQRSSRHQTDGSDPTVIAESELLGAASSIDAAAKKLENLKPRVSSVKLPHDDLNFDEIILEAAKSIIEATAALLRAASASQRELIVDGRLDETETFYASDNNQWSEGLISAARMVAAATHSLVEAANSLVGGQASEERLISAAKQVASSTNQLLVACKVKADPDSRTMSRLANAGNQVKRATDNLVRAAQQAIEHDEEQSLIISNKKVSGIAQEISAREQILRKEKELHVAKTQLMAIRKAKYANRPDDYQGYGGSLD